MPYRHPPRQRNRQAGYRTLEGPRGIAEGALQEFTHARAESVAQSLCLWSRNIRIYVIWRGFGYSLRISAVATRGDIWPYERQTASAFMAKPMADVRMISLVSA